jgi:hypothetical protein
VAGASHPTKYPGGLPPSSRDFRAAYRTNCLRPRGSFPEYRMPSFREELFSVIR